MHSSKLVTTLALALPVAALSATLTNDNIDTRTTTNVLSFSDLAFDNLDKVRTDVLQFQGAVGDSGTFNVTGAFNPGDTTSVVSGSGISISNVTAPGAFGFSWTATVVGSANQTVTQSWSMAQTTSVVTGVTGGGLNYLEFNGNNNGFLKTGGTFDYSVTLPGDWSTQGTATGDSQLLGLGAGFVVTKDFVFDPTSNTTTVEVLSTSYAAGSPNVGLNFMLYGSTAVPVDEPTPTALLLAGLGAIGWIGRRRQRG